jgi:hypothetical protein
MSISKSGTMVETQSSKQAHILGMGGSWESLGHGQNLAFKHVHLLDVAHFNQPLLTP